MYEGIKAVFYPLWILLAFCNGLLMEKLCAPFLQLRPGKLWKAALILCFAGSSGMVIWVGDPNLFYTLPVFLAVFFACTRGDWVGRLAVCLVMFSLLMSLCALSDSYLGDWLGRPGLEQYIFTRLVRPLVLGAIWLALRRRLPARPVQLPRRLWKLALGLAALPVCSLAAVVLLATPYLNQPEPYAVSMAMGLAVLPVVLLTSVVLLVSFTLLAEHEALEQAGRLAALREVYYQGLQGQEDQVRRLRHDLRNHLTALQGLLARGQTKAADDYLKQLLDSAALHGRRRLCENETADIVLSAKAQAMEQAGVNARFRVSLPKELPLAPTDLCALLGNALDNALEAARRTPEGWVSVRARADKGLLMLRVENSAPGLPVREKNGRFATNKADKSAHGFGLAGMEEIARRCGGTLEAKAEEGRFALTVCIPLASSCENREGGV